MIAYVDSSVLLRIVLGQPQRLSEWETIARGVTSALTEVECLRTLDRHRLRSLLTDVQIADRLGVLFRSFKDIDVVDLDRPILARASQSFTTVLGTLDALHLATALLWRDREAPDLVFATHDGALATGARAHGMPVVGI